MFRYIRALCSIAMVFAVTGCATSGLSGTTTLNSQYHSNVQADGSEDTTVSITAKGKAGDVLEAVSNASLSTKDGTGSERIMSFGANQKNDALQRGANIEHLNDTWAPIVGKGLDTAKAGIDTAGALIGQNIQTKGATAQAEIAAKAQTRSELIDAFKTIAPTLTSQQLSTLGLTRIAPATPSPAPVGTPAPATVAPRLPSTPPATPPATSPEPDKPLNADGTVPADTIVPKPNN